MSPQFNKLLSARDSLLMGGVHAGVEKKHFLGINTIYLNFVNFATLEVISYMVSLLHQG